MNATYVVTERAGPKVAGHRVKAGDELALTEAEAAHELREGTIVRKGATLDPAYSADSEPLAALRRAASGKDAPARPGTPSEAPQAPVEAASKPARKGGKGE